ncbi:MAG: hypothetical protein ACK4NW_06850 [Roseinatronobacter sp.]
MTRILPYLTLVATAAFLISPYVTDPFTGFDPARFPVPQQDPPVQPAGYAFAIWGVIYLWLAVMALAGVALRRDDPAWRPVQLPLILSLGPGAAWLWVAGFAPLEATALIFWMLGTALWALFKLPQKDRWLLQAPVALYAGWLTAAAHVSLGVALGGYGLFVPEIAAVVALGLAVALALLVLWLRPQVLEYGAAVLWALVGVLVANLDKSLLVPAATVLALGLVGLAIGRGLWTGQRAQGL